MANIAPALEIVDTSIADISAARREMLGLQQQVAAESQTMVAQSRGPQFVSDGETAMSLIQKQQAALQSQQFRQQQAQIMESDALLSTIGADIRDLGMQRRQLAQKVATDSSVSLFDDPMQAITNAFTLPWDRQALAAVDTQLNAATDLSSKIHTHMTNASKVADYVKDSVTAGTVADVATAAEIMQARVGAKTRIDAMESNSRAVSRVLEMDGKLQDAYVKRIQLVQSEEQLALNRAQEARQMQILELDLEEKRAKKEDKLAADNQELEYINAALKDAGKGQLSDIPSMKQLKGTSAKWADALLRRGMELGAGKTSFGNTIEERNHNMSLVGWRPDPKLPAQTTIVEMQANAWQEASATGVTKEGLSKEANKRFDTTFKDGQKNIKEGSAFKAPSYSTFMSHDKSSIANDPLWQKYVAPTLNATTAAMPVSEQFILDTLAGALDKGEITLGVASAFSKKVFDTAVTLNNVVNGFDKIAGLRQERYGSRLEVGPSPFVRAAAAVATVGGAAAITTGIGTLPGAIAMTAGAAATLLDPTALPAELTNKQDWEKALLLRVASIRGAALNTAGTPYRGGANVGSTYPPLFNASIGVAP